MSAMQAFRQAIFSRPSQWIAAALGRGIVAREFRVAAPALLGIPAIAFVVLMMIRVADGASGLSFALLREAFFAQTALICVIAGVLGGAEEEENGTADFAARLPLAPSQAFLRKLSGSLLTLAAGAAVGLAILALVASLFSAGGASGFDAFVQASGGRSVAAWIATWVLYYAASLGIGSWVRRVIPATLVAAATLIGLETALANMDWMAGKLGLAGSGQAAWHANHWQDKLAVIFPLVAAIPFAWAAWARHQFRASALGMPMFLRFDTSLASRRDFSPGLAATDAHSRRIVLLIAAASGILLPPQPTWAFFSCAIGALLLGAGLFGPEERDPTRGLIYALPIPRSRALLQKLLGLGRGLGALALVLALSAVVGAGINVVRRGSTDLAPDLGVGAFFFLCFLPIVALIAAAMSFHFRSPIVTALLATGVAIPLAIITFTACPQIDTPFGYSERKVAASIEFALRCAALAAALAAWLFWLFCRSPILEMEDRARGFWGVISAIAFVQAAAWLFLTDWRDLAFMLLGI